MNDEELTALLGGRKALLAERTWRCLSETRVAAYVDGALDARELEAIEAHLADCAHCAGEVAVLVRLEPAEPPPSLNQELIQQARRLATAPTTGRLAGGARQRLASGCTRSATPNRVRLPTGSRREPGSSEHPLRCSAGHSK